VLCYSGRRPGRRPGFRPVTDRFELSRHVQIARTWSQRVQAIFHYAILLTSRSQTSSRPNSITMSSLRGDQLASWSQTVDLLASWSQFGQPNGIWSRTGLRPASELDSVTEFGLRHAHDMHTQVFDHLLAALEPAREPAREQVCDQLMSLSQAG